VDHVAGFRGNRDRCSDQVPADAAGLAHVTQVVRAVRGPVVRNPGTRGLPGHAALADVV